MNKKLGNPNPDPNPDPNKPTIPKELQEQLDELKKFKEAELIREKTKNVLKLAKQSIRQDLHSSFDAYAGDFSASLDKEEKEQVENLVSKFQAIFKETIGDIKPLAPRQTAQVEKEMLEGVVKIEL